MDLVLAIGLGALAGGIVAYLLAVAHRAYRRKIEPDAPRIRLEVVGTVLGAVVAGFVGPFVSLPTAVALAALSPLIVPPLVLLFSFPFRPRE